MLDIIALATYNLIVMCRLEDRLPFLFAGPPAEIELNVNAAGSAYISRRMLPRIIVASLRRIVRSRLFFQLQVFSKVIPYTLTRLRFERL